MEWVELILRMIVNIVYLYMILGHIQIYYNYTVKSPAFVGVWDYIITLRVH